MNWDYSFFISKNNLFSKQGVNQVQGPAWSPKSTGSRFAQNVAGTLAMYPAFIMKSTKNPTARIAVSNRQPKSP
jgi:hypothetical protein